MNKEEMILKLACDGYCPKNPTVTDNCNGMITHWQVCMTCWQEATDEDVISSFARMKENNER